MADGAARDPLRDVQSMAARRMTEYVDVWQHAAQRLVDGRYHSEDLLDDAFSLWGKWLRDSTAAAAMLWGLGGTPGPVEDADDR